MNNWITHEHKTYPSLQTQGFAAQYAFPFAKQMLNGEGLDIGCAKEDWKFPGAKGIDLTFDNEWNALNLPEKSGGWDYIFSSHCLEHLDDWVGVLDYWLSNIREGGLLFLYLPSYSQTYWRPWNNRKHKQILEQKHLTDYFVHNGYTNMFVSDGYDLNNSFYAIVEK